MVQDLIQRIQQRLSDHQVGETESATALDAAETATPGAEGTDLVSRLRGRVTEQTPMGVSDAWQDLWGGGWKEKLPFLGGAVSAKKYHSLWEASKRIETGTQTRDDEELILAFVAESQREQGIGYMVGSILAELPGFVIEFAASGGAWNLGKKGALKLAGKAIREGAEKAAAKLTLREVKKKTFGQAAKAGVARGLGAMANTTGQLGAMSIMGEIAGGSRVSAEAWRRALPEMSLSVDDADRLALTFHTTATEFVDHLPAAILDQFIELLSERSGGALMAGAAKIPGVGYVAAMQAEVADWWIRKYPGGMTKLMQTVAQKGGWHGPVSEFLEERMGGALRGATGVNEGGILENTFPSLEQAAAEMIAFSVPSAIGMGGQALFQTPKPEDKKAGFEAPGGESRRTFAQSELDGMVQSQVQEMEKELDLPRGTIGYVEGTPEGFEDVAEDFRQRGLSAFFVGTADGAPLPGQARLGDEGIVLVDVNMEQDPAEVSIHELVHDLDSVAPEVGATLRESAQRTDGEAYEKYLSEYEAAYERETGKPLPEALRDTEGAANYAEQRASLIYMARTENGRMALQQLVQNNRSVAQKLIDWMVRGLNSLGVNVRQAQQIRLDRLSKALGVGVTVEAAETALLFQEALEVMVGRTAAVDRVVTPLLGAGPVPLQLPENASGPRAMAPGVRPSERPGVKGEEVGSEVGLQTPGPGRAPRETVTPITPSVIPLEGQKTEPKYVGDYSPEEQHRRYEEEVERGNREVAETKAGRSDWAMRGASGETLSVGHFEDAEVVISSEEGGFNIIERRPGSEDFIVSMELTIEDAIEGASSHIAISEGTLTKEALEGGATPPSEVLANLPKGEVEVVQFASGLTRSPSDAQKEMDAGNPVGVSAHGKISKPMRQKLIEYARRGGKVFLDSGAFTTFTQGEKVDWDRTFDLYEEIVTAVEVEEAENITIVAPDVVGDHEATFDLLGQVLGYQLDDLLASGANVIFPVQRGGHGRISANFADLTDLQDAKFWNNGRAIVGIPFNKAAWSQEDVLEFLRAYSDMSIKPRIHLLGGGAAKVQALIDAAEAEGLPIEYIGGDALAPSVSARKRGGKKKPEKEATLPETPPISTGGLPASHEMAELDADEVGFKLHEGVDMSTYEARSKEEEEQIEVRVSVIANDIAATPGASKEWVFEQLADLYSRQPRPNIRTTESVLAQQYSTPAPLAYVAGKLLGKVGRIYEPSAGHGLLLTALPRKQWEKRAILNELNPGRNARLAALGQVEVHQEDAATWHPRDPYHAVLANPPFGTVLGDDLKATRRRISLGKGSSFETSQVDHQIVAEALGGMVSVGRAVLIIGSQKSLKRGEKERAEGRRKAYATGQKRLFFRDLYKNWNVTDHVTVSGDLYKNQGAAWPIDIIVINGQGESKLALPGSVPPQVLESWDEVESLLGAEGRKSYRQLRPNKRGKRGKGGVPATGDGPASSPDSEGDGSGGAVPGEDVRGGSGVGSSGERPADTGAGVLPGQRGGADTDATPGRPGAEVAEGGTAQPGGKSSARPGEPGGVAGGSQPSDPLDLDDLIGGAIDDAYGEEDDLPPGVTFTKAKIIPTREGIKTELVEGKPEPEIVKRVRAAKKKAEAPKLSEEDQGLADIAGLFSVRGFHGSPHRFDKFETGKIGTGEGAQAYGWGLYFSDREKIAKHYRKALSDWREANLSPVVAALPESERSRDNARRIMSDINAALEDGSIVAASEYLAAMQVEPRLRSAYKVASGIFENTGATYRVTLAPEQDEYLLWDEPLSNQSVKVKVALGRMPLPDYAQYYPEPIGHGLYADLSRDKGSDKAASLALLAAGVRGVKYKTGSARGTEKAEFNYVIFDENDVAIEAQYSVRKRPEAFDQEKYDKIAPAFTKKLDAAGVDPSDEPGIVRTIVEFFRDVLKLTKKQLQGVAFYISEFVEDVRAGDITWGERTKIQPSAPGKAVPEDTEGQVGYRGASKARRLSTLVPKNMQTAMEQSLRAIQDEHGDIDEYVAGELGWDVERLHNVMGQEQVDAVALAIRSAQNGDAFILGDQTGVGKGRIVASMIHWSRRNGQVPVFMTQDKGLYADMVRDLYDIAVYDIKPYMTNAPFKAFEAEGVEDPITGKPVFIRGQAKKKREEMEAEMEKTGALPAGFNAVFTTYSQSTLKKAQKVGRHRAIEAMAHNAFFVLDESHNAGGQELDAAAERAIEEGTKFPRSQWIRDLLEASAGAMFSSATFAKNPYVMTLYAKTDMGKAFDDIEKLTAIIKKGGVPMQQILSNMLVEAGQYVRREKSFEGIEFGAKDVEVSMEAADATSGTMRSLFNLDYNDMERVRADYRRIILPKRGGEAFRDVSTGTNGSDATFASTMHNLIGQALLSMKASQVAEEAIEEWKKGRKPIIALDSTMGEMLKRTIEQEGLVAGQRLSDPSFRHAMMKYLESTRSISLKDDDGKLLERVYISDEEMIELGHGHRLARYNEVKKHIAETDLGDMTMSPIDQILQKMKAAGMKVDEITGRAWTINDIGGENRVSGRRHNSATKKGAMRAFNSGILDALVINRSGSTGFSLHAGEKFKDQRQRIMMIAQPAQNIDDYMQTLGRINRTGQVIEPNANATLFEGGAYGLPIYRVMFANLPHEMRAKAMLQNKMKALNASTTASAGSAVTLGGVTDFINRYGDQVVYEMLRENPELTSRLHLFHRIFPSDERSAPSITDLAKQTTNRLPVLTVAEQRDLYEQIDFAYKAYVAYLDSVGLNTLEAKLEELDAKTVTSHVVQQETGPSPFEGAVYEERVDMVKLNPPIAYEEMVAKVKETDTAPMVAEVQKASDARVADLREREAELHESGREVVAEIAKLGATEPDTPEAHKKARLTDRAASLDTQANRLKITAEKVPSDAAALVQLLESVSPGAHLGLVMREGDEMSALVHGVITSLVHKKKAKSALSASDYVVTINTSASTAPLKLPLSKLRSGIIVVDASKDDVREAVDEERASGREERSIVTGNLVRGAGSYLGQLGTRLSMYRTAEGTVKAGLLLPRNVSVADIEAQFPLELSPAQAVQAIGGTTQIKVSDKNGVVTAKGKANSDRIMIGLRPRGKAPYLKAAEPLPFTQRKGKGPFLSGWLAPEHATRVLGEFERVPGFGLRVTERGEKARARTVLGLDAGEQGGSYSVRKRRAKHQNMGFDIGPESGLDRFRRVTQDRDIRVRRFEEQLLSRGGVVPEQFSTYGAIERFPGRVEAHLRRWAREIYDPLMTHLGENEIDADQADDFAWVRHAPERNRVVAKKHRDEWLAAEIGRVKAKAQRTAQKAQERIDEIGVQISATTDAGEADKLGALRDEWKVKRAEALRTAKAPMGAVGAPPADLPFQDHRTKKGGSGMSDQEAEKRLKEFLEGDKGDAYRKLGTLIDRMNTRTRKLQLASGLISQETYDRWEEDYEHYVPLRTAYQDQMDTYGRRFEIKRPESREARGRKSAAHSPLAFSIVQAERAIVRGHKNEVGNAFLQLIESNAELIKDYSTRDTGEVNEEEDAEQIPQEALPQEGEFSTKVKGHEVYIKVKDSLLLRALMNVGVDETGPAVRIFGKINRVLAQLNTSLDPGFMLSNFFRDLQTAGINIGGEQSAKMMRSVVGSTLSTKPIQAVWKGLKGKKDPNDPWLVSFHEMEKAGGLTGWYTLPDFEAKLSTVRNALKDANPSNGRKVWIGIKAFGEAIDRANRAVENGARLSAYHHARANGQSVKQAASLAKNLTVNFNRKGEWGTAMNAFYLFYNASMQGTVRMFQALKHRHVQYTVAGIAAAAFALDLINAAIGGDDDDGVPFYDKIPEWIKARNLILMDPFGSGNYAKIPLPYGYNVPHAFGQVVASLQRGAIGYGEASRQMVGVSWESFYPLGSEATFIQTIMPTMADPLVQIAENKTFWGGPIRPTPYGSPAPPDSQLYWSTVDPVLKSATDALNSLTGGDEVVSGWADFSPEDLEHVIQFSTGGVGRQVKRTIDSLTALFSGEPVEMHKIPILRRMAGTQDQRYDRETYIENRNDVKRAVEQLENAAGDPGAQQRVREDSGELIRLQGSMKATESRLRKIRKFRRQTDDKERQKQLDERMKQIQKTFNKRFQEAMG